MNTKKLFTILSLVIGSSTSVKGVCWSKDYPCCKQEIDINTVAIYQDPDSKHYYSNEDGHICAVVVGDQDKCPSGDIYPCCKTCDVVYTDQEDWGVEDGSWCSIPFSCNPTPTRTTLSLPPIVVTPGTEVCSLENEPCGGSLYENTVSGCCEEGLVCYKRSSFYHYCVSQDLFEDFQQPTEVVTTTTTTSVSGKATSTTTTTTTDIIAQQTNNPYFFPPPPPPPPRFYGNFGPNFNPNCSRPYDYCGIDGYPECCQKGFICTMNGQDFKQCLEDPEQIQVYAIGQGGNYFYPPPPPPYYPPPYYPGNPQQGQPVHGEGNPGDMYPYNPPPNYPPPNYPPPPGQYPPPNYPPPGQYPPGQYPPPNYPPPNYPPPYYPPPYYPPPYVPANVTTTTTTVKPKPTTCAKAYYPCGGVDFPDAPNCCQEGYYCNTDNPDFFVCKEIELVTITTTTTTEPPTATETPAEKCAAVFGMCGGSKFKDVPTCCQAGSYCLKVSAEYYQCIPDEYKAMYSDYDVKKTTTAAQKTTTTAAAAQKTTTTAAAAQKTTTTAAAAKKTTTTAAAQKTTTTAAAAKTTTTAAAKTTAAAASDGECAKVYEACGGVNHTGPTCCEPRTKCIAFNQYHHQCIPEDAEGYEDFV